MAREAPGHVEPSRGVQRHVGEADLLHPFRKPPVPLIAPHQAGPAVPLGRIRAAIDASQGIEVDVIGGAQPIRLLVRAADAQEGLTPVVLPPGAVLGLQRFQRNFHCLFKLAPCRRGGIAGGSHRRGDHQAVLRWSLGWDDHLRRRAVDGATRRRLRRASHYHRGSAPQHRVAGSVEVVLHGGAGKVRPGGTRVYFMGVDGRRRRAHFHRRPPLGQLNGWRLEQSIRIDHLHHQDLPLGMPPNLEPRTPVFLTQPDHHAAVIKIEPLPEELRRLVVRPGTEVEVNVSGTDVVEEPGAERGIGWGLESPRVRLRQVQMHSAVEADHGRQVTAAGGHGLPRLDRRGGVKNVVSRDHRPGVQEPPAALIVVRHGLARRRGGQQ